MASPERKIAKLTCLSCKHTFSSSGNLYKHYKTFSDHRPEGKPFISCKEAADEFLDRNLSPYHRKARLREFFNGRLSKEELLELALPQVARMVRTSRFMYEKCKIKSGEIRKEAVKHEFLAVCENLFRTFPSPPKELAVSCNSTMTSLLQWIRPIRDSTSNGLPLSCNSSNKQFIKFLDDRHEKKTLLENLIIDNTSLACETMLSCCCGRVFKSTLMPMFVKKHHEAFLEFGLGIVSSFNIGQNQINSILRGYWGKKLEEKTGLNPILPR